METIIVSTTLPAALAAAIDKLVSKTLSSRSAWLRIACFEKAERDRLIRREAATEAGDAFDLDRVMG